MSESKKGPVWGGAAEEWMQKKPERTQKELEHKKEIELAIADLSGLFDTNNFQDLITHLNLIIEGGIENIQVGDKTYPARTIKELIGITIEDFSDGDRAERVKTGAIQDKRIIQYLKERGVTENKISEESLHGFRECILMCIKKMCGSEV